MATHFRISRRPKLNVVVYDGAVVAQDDEMDCCDTAEDLFNVLNSLCEFAKWGCADAYVDDVHHSEIFTSGAPSENRASVTRALVVLLVTLESLTQAAGLAMFVHPIRLEILVQNRREDATTTDGRDGPIYGIHPGIPGIGGGWGPGWYERWEERPGAYNYRPHGPDNQVLAKIRGVLYPSHF